MGLPLRLAAYGLPSSAASGLFLWQLAADSCLLMAVGLSAHGHGEWRTGASRAAQGTARLQGCCACPQGCVLSMCMLWHVFCRQLPTKDSTALLLVWLCCAAAWSAAILCRFLPECCRCKRAACSMDKGGHGTHARWVNASQRAHGITRPARRACAQTHRVAVTQLEAVNVKLAWRSTLVFR